MKKLSMKTNVPLNLSYPIKTNIHSLLQFGIFLSTNHVPLKVIILSSYFE